MKWGHDLILCKINFFLQFISHVKAVVRLIPQPEIYVALYLKFFYFFCIINLWSEAMILSFAKLI